MIGPIYRFIKDSFKELNPWHNIKLFHTNVKGDILAGITVAIIALPMALAFGEMSQLGPVAGLWGAIAGGIIGGFFGGCVVGMSGPTAPKAAQIATFMSVIVGGSEDPYVAAFSIIFLSGLIMIFISMLKISKFIHYIPYSVVAGFMCGIGVIVILTQINAFVGLPNEKSIHAVFKNLGATIQNINIEALFVAVPSLLILFLWRPIVSKYNFLKSVPSPLIALIVGTGIASFMELKIPLIGEAMNQSTSSDIFSFYFPDFTQLAAFLGPAFALAGLAILDSLLSCKVADNMTGSRHSSDRETFGQGMANMAAGLFGGVTTATATMRTVANIKFGGKTPLSSIIHGLTLLGILLGLGFLVENIPNACLAAILFKVGIDILDYRILAVLRKIPITDFCVFVVVLFVTVYSDLMIAVGIGFLLAFLSYFKDFVTILRSGHKHKIIPFQESELISMESVPKKLNSSTISFLRLEGSFFFGSTEPVISAYKNSQKHKFLIIDITNISSIDLSGIYALEDLVLNAQKNNITVFVFNTNPDIKSTIEKVGFIKNIGKENYKEEKDFINSLGAIS